MNMNRTEKLLLAVCILLFGLIWTSFGGVGQYVAMAASVVGLGIAIWEFLTA